MQTRALVKDRARRNLLLLIDGTKSEESLLANIVGVGADDFQELRKLNLIAPAAGAVTLGAGGRPGSAADASRAAPHQALPAAPLDYGLFTAALTKLISENLGLRGFTLTLAVEKAGTSEELQSVAHRVIELIRERKGAPTAAEARKTLFGS